MVVSTESGAGGGRSFVALADVELLALRADPAASAYAGEDSGAGAAPSALATLRVTLRQAVYLTAADNFGREIRLLARPPGDRSRGGAAISAAELLSTSTSRPLGRAEQRALGHPQEQAVLDHARHRA